METKKILFQAGKPNVQPIPVPSYCQPAAAGQTLEFHRGLTGYKPTTLHDVVGLAALAGVKHVLLKDEAERFGLNAFKVLGASFATAKLLAERLALPSDKLNLATLAAKARATKEQLTFVTATDGNHGRAVAWAAQQLGQSAVVYMPQGTAQSRVDAIAGHGAEVIVIDGNYDIAVQFAAEQAENNGWLLVQDTAWDSYQQIPAWIMQGYTTLAAEAWEQMQTLDVQPTHVFLQAGVGSFAAAQLAYWQSLTDLREPPQFIVMEPDNAACFYRSVEQGGGQSVTVGGDLQTIMAGLSCGTPSQLAWPLLRDYAAAFVSCPDYVAAYGMRILGNPWQGGQHITAGESGAVGAGLIALLAEPAYAAWRQRLALDENSVVLLINTEGATDPINYQDIVWGGKHPLP